MKNLTSIQWAIAGILIASGGIVALNRFRPVDYRDLGISLVNESTCEEQKDNAKYYGGVELWAEVLHLACDEPKTKLSPAGYAEEQNDLRELRDKQGNLSDGAWDLSRSTVELRMRMRRLNAIEVPRDKPTTPVDTEPTP
jgi:hypothetical protein